MHRFSAAFLVLSLLALCTGCEKKDDTVNVPPPTGNPTFTSSSVKDAPIYFSFDTQKEVSEWDVKFGEYTMPPAPGLVPMPVVNARRLGDAFVTVFDTKATALAAVASVPADSLAADLAGGIVSASWYNYDPATHTMSSKGRVYAVKAADGKTYKFRIDDFTNKIFTVSWSMRKSDSTWTAPQTLVVDINTGEKFVSFAKGFVTPADWDVKLTVISVPSPIGPMNFPGIALNRVKNVLGKIVNGKSFADVDPSAETGLTADLDTSYAIGTECLNYDETTHKLNPYAQRTFVVSTVAGKRVKLQLLSYYNDQGASGYMKFEYVVK